MIKMIGKLAKKVAFISSYLPRRCGIATFTSDLINNMVLAGGKEFEARIFATQPGTDLEYDKPVKLERIVRDLGLQRNVVFYNRFVSDKELFQFLGSADVYVTPYLHKQQLTSGTLAFAVGAGKAVVSIPYLAAQELLAHGRGRLVRFVDSEHIARSVVELLNNSSLFSWMKRRAHEYGRSMIWPKVGQTYWKLFRICIPSIPIHLRPTIDLPDWNIPAYGQRKIYQPA